MNKIYCRNYNIRFEPDRSIYPYSWDRPFAHEDIFNKTLEWLEAQGFKVEIDPDTLRNYPSIAKDYYKCSKGKFYYRTHIYQNGFELEFREVNPNITRGWNCWDDEFSHIALLFKKSMKNKFYEFFKENFNDCEIDLEVEYKSSEEKIKNRFVRCWHHPQKNMDWKLSDLDGTPPSHEHKDRDGKIIKNGDFKYYRDYSGYLRCGKVYEDINGNYCVAYNKTKYDVIYCNRLFDLTKNDIKVRRLKKGFLPITYLDKVNQDNPANHIRKILDSKITPRKLGQLFADYFEGRGIEQRDFKLKTIPEEYYYIEGKCWSWNKVSCVYHTPKTELEIVFREEEYIIVSVDEERIIELDRYRIIHWNKEALEKCFKKYKNLFNRITGCVDRMRKKEGKEHESNY